MPKSLVQNKAKNSQTKGEQHLELNKAVTLITEKFEEHEREKVEREKITKEMQKQIEDMSAIIQSFKVSLEMQEQYSTRNCLLIHELPVIRNENTGQINIEMAKKMGEEMDEVDLDRTHRLGVPKEKKVRPIIVKFARYNTRSRVSRNKKKLKRKKVSLTESSTKMQMEALKRAPEEFEFHVWTYDGKIM